LNTPKKSTSSERSAPRSGVLKQDRENDQFAARDALAEIIEATGRQADVIHYLVPHPEQNLTEATPLQGFTPDLLESAPLYVQIASLPKCIPELSGSNEGVIRYRMVTKPYIVLPVEVTGLERVLDHIDPFCASIWSATDDIATYC
jgi:hypothetical protein